jgi:hypothetical protein
MDEREKLAAALDEARRQWEESDRQWGEARRQWVEARRRLRDYDERRSREEG